MASPATARAAAATSPPTTPPMKRAKIAGVADPENPSTKSPDTERWTGDVQVAGEGLGEAHFETGILLQREKDKMAAALFLPSVS